MPPLQALAGLLGEHRDREEGHGPGPPTPGDRDQHAQAEPADPQRHRRLCPAGADRIAEPTLVTDLLPPAPFQGLVAQKDQGRAGGHKGIHQLRQQEPAEAQRRPAVAGEKAVVPPAMGRRLQAAGAQGGTDGAPAGS
jgi:hypothetical protein